MILVTGGTGFLGRFLVARLCQAGHKLRVLTRTRHHAWLAEYPNVDIVQADLTDPDTFAHALDGCTQVIHAAGLFSMWGGAGDFTATNTTGTEHLLRLSVAAGIQRFVYVSTAAVIGTPIPGCIVDESHPARPADAYQQSKLDAERRVLAAFTTHGLPSVVVRPGAFYGPLGNYAFNRLFFTDPLRGIIMQMDGGKYTIFPVYIDDVAQGIIGALHHGRSGEIYNLCGECLTHRAAFRIIRDQAHLWAPPLNIPRVIGLNFARFLTAVAGITGIEPFYPVGLKSYVFNDWQVSSAKAQRELGFVPLPFAQGVTQTLAWYKSGKPATLPELVCASQTGAL